MIMISTFSNYFNVANREMESSELTDEQRAVTIDNIKTTNLLRKLRKIDSSENILNLVQLTDYKKSTKSQPRKSKPKRTKSIRQDTQECKEKVTHVETEESGSKTSNTIVAKESNTSIGRNILKEESYHNIGNELNKIDEGYSTGGIPDEGSDNYIRNIIPARELDTRLKIEKISQTFHTEKSELNVDEDIQKECEATSIHNGMKKSNTEICRKPKGENINITVKSNCINSSYESITEGIVKQTSSKYFETISTVEGLYGNLQVMQENVSTQDFFSPCRSEIMDKMVNLRNASETNVQNTTSKMYLNTFSKSNFVIVKDSSNSKVYHSKESLHESLTTVVPKYLKEENVMKSNSKLNTEPSEHKHEVEMKKSIEIETDQSATKHLVEENESCDSEETNILFSRDSVSNESMDLRIVNFDHSKIPIPIKNKPIETIYTNEKVVGYSANEEENVDKKENINEKENVKEITKESLENKMESIDSKDQTLLSTENDKTVQEIDTEDALKNAEEKVKPQTDKTLRADVSSIMNIKENPCPTKVGKIKSKLSIFNSGVGVIRGSKRNLNKNKGPISKIPLNLGNVVHTNKSYATMIARRKQHEENKMGKTMVKTSFRNVSKSFVNPISSNNLQIEKTKKMPTIRKEKSKIESKICTTKPSVVHTTLRKSETLYNLAEDKVDNSSCKMDIVKDSTEERFENIENYKQGIHKENKTKKELDDTDDKANELNQIALLDIASYVKSEKRKVTLELKKYCEYVEDVMSEVAMEEALSTSSSNALKTKLELLKEKRRRSLEAKGMELTEFVLQVIAYMGAEYKILSQNCEDMTKRHEECVKKLTEKMVRLEKEKEILSAQVTISPSQASFSCKNNVDGMLDLNADSVLDLKKKDERFSEIIKMYNDIEMKNNYHAQLVENFMKSVKMIEKKIEHHSEIQKIQEEKAKSEMKIADLKREELEENINQLKQKIQDDQLEQQDLIEKLDEYQHIVNKLKMKNKALHKELLKYKYPLHLEKNIQKMITLRNMLVNIVHKNEDDKMPLPDDKLLDIMRQIDHVDPFFPVLKDTGSSIDRKDSMTSESTSTKIDIES